MYLKIFQIFRYLGRFSLSHYTSYIKNEIFMIEIISKIV